jgi:endoglucanase
MKTVLKRYKRLAGVGLILGLVLTTFVPGGKQASIHADSSPIAVWWPSAGSHVAGVQPFKAMVTGLDPSVYHMTWRVDGGSEVPMNNSYQDYPHKEALVDLSSWTWDGANPYKITYTAYDGMDKVIGTKETDLYTNSIGQPSPAVLAANTVAPATAEALPQAAITQTKAKTSFQSGSNSNPFYALPSDDALSTAAALAGSNATNAAILRRIGSTPTAQWFGGWNSNVGSDVNNLVSAASNAGKIPVLVTYNIPNRDCGSYSAGGSSASSYGSWIRAFASGLKGRSAYVIVEPDALSNVSCLTSGDQSARYAMLADAVNVINGDANAKIYLDAGHDGWIDPGTMANRLNQSGISVADGFSLNVSNFGSTQANTVYGHALSSRIGGKHFVIDTSRNGSGGTAGGQWCNPSGQALGLSPTTATNDPWIDAYLWLKTPGESDGACNGGPSAGSWWADYAITLGRNAGY